MGWGIEDALLRIDKKLDVFTDRFGALGKYMKEMSERIDALPERIADANGTDK